MSQLRIFPDPALRIPARPVTLFDEPGGQGGVLFDLVRRMSDVCVTGNGIGLAAPQIGHAMRVVVLRDLEPPEVKGMKKGMTPFFAFVNPVITAHSAEVEDDIEGCLSLPGVRMGVERSLRIEVEAQDTYGEPMTLVLEGQEARVIAHECDHLDGKLIVDYGDPRLWFNRMIEYRTVLERQGQFDREAWGMRPLHRPEVMPDPALIAQYEEAFPLPEEDPNVIEPEHIDFQVRR